MSAPESPSQQPPRGRGGTRRLAFFGLLGSGNLGNEGSLEAVLQHFRQHHPEVELWAVCSGPEQVEREHGLRALPMSVYRPDAARPRAVAAVRKVWGKLADPVRMVSLVRRFDAVVVPGMGVLEDSLPVRPWGFPWALFGLAFAGRLTGTPVALVSVGANRVHNPATRWLMVSTARLASYRSYRDTYSRDAMQAMGLDTGQDVVTPDVAFDLPAPEGVVPRPGSVAVGVIDYHGSEADRDRAEELHAAYLDTMTGFVSWLLDQGHRVEFLTGDPVDEQVAVTIASAVRDHRPGLEPDRLVLDPAASLHELMVRISAAEVVVASRFHNVLCSLRLARPTISLSYAEKNDVLMTALGLGDYCQDLRSLDLERLVAQFRAVRADHARVEAGMRAAVSDYQTQLAEQYARLSDLLLGRSAGVRHPPMMRRRRTAA